MARKPNGVVIVGHNFYRLNVLKNKDFLFQTHMMTMINRCQEIFEWTGLPDTIPQRDLEMIIQNSRFAIFKKVDNEFYVFFGGLGGVPDVYYHPSDAIISNPYLKYFDICEIDKECVIIWNDSARMGLLPIHSLYAEQLAEVDISMRYANVFARIPALISASDDITKASAEEFMKKIDDGTDLAIIGESAFFEGVKSSELGTNRSSTIKDLIEERQYLKASWFNDLGVNANYNMKRESINESEASMNEDALMPLVDNMLKERKIACEKINKMFNLNISVDFSSAWKKIREDVKLEQEMKESQIVDEESPINEKEEEPDENNI